MTTSPGATEVTEGTPSGVPPAVSLHAVHKSFGPVHAVRGMDLTVHSGEVVAFLGPNGAGKTTTLDMILGLSEPSRGTVEVYGMTPQAAISRGLVSAVMQTGGLLKDFTVRETLRYIGSIFASSEPVDAVLERAGITAIADQLVGKCSGGEQQRLRFGLALLSDPELLLLDEPTAGMDVDGRRAFWAAIREDASKGRTVMFATHYLEEADLYADRVVLVRQGQVVADGTSAQIKAMSAGRTVRATVPGLSAELVRALPTGSRAEMHGEQLVITTRDADAVARHLLTRTEAHDLEITSQGLEDAFIALTSTDSATANATDDAMDPVTDPATGQTIDRGEIR